MHPLLRPSSQVLITTVLIAIFALAISFTSSSTSSYTNTQDYTGNSELEQEVMAAKQSMNVFKGPLSYFGGSPIKTGFTRNGYCEVPASDYGNHAVAAEVTEEFLDFTARQGNDLRIAGLTGGCRWCLCVSRWREAFDARKNDTDAVVPRVFLSATNEKALNKVTLDELKMFAAKE